MAQYLEIVSVSDMVVCQHHYSLHPTFSDISVPVNGCLETLKEREGTGNRLHSVYKELCLLPIQIYFVCECMFVSLSVSVCPMCVGAHECQKGSDPLELEF